MAADLPYLECPPLEEQVYGRWFTDHGVWAPYVDEVARRHGLPPPGPLSTGVPGSHPVFLTDHAYAVKFYAPHWKRDGEAEAVVYGALGGAGAAGRAACPPRGDLAAAVPRRLGAGELFPRPGGRWPWPYIILSTVAGRSAGQVRDLLAAGEFLAMATRLGGLVRALHGLPVRAGADRLAAASRTRMAARRRAAAERRRREGGWPASLLRALDPYVEGALADAARVAPVLVHGDLTDDHVLLEADGDRWRLSGLIDFGDAQITDPAYDLVALHLDLFRCEWRLLRAFLDGYGGEAALGPAWRARATAFVLIFPFDTLAPVAQHLDGWETVRTPGDLEAALWPPAAP